MDTLEELQEMQRKSSKISHDDVINMVRAPAEEIAKRQLERQEEEDEAFVRFVLLKIGEVHVFMMDGEPDGWHVLHNLLFEKEGMILPAYQRLNDPLTDAKT